MQIPPHIRGLIFDCDGTIADTMPAHYQAWLRALGEHGQDFPEAMFYEMAGIPTRKIIEILNEKHGYTLPVERATRAKEDYYVELIPKVTAIEPVVKLLREHANTLPMAVATGGTRSICTQTLAAVDLLKFFPQHLIVTADDVEHGKPAPDIFLEAARRINVDPSLCMAFEDAELGFQSARAAGMTVVDIRPMRA